MPMFLLASEHFRHIVSKFADQPELGVAGAPFREGAFQYDYRFTNIENVWGGCQLFRRECFEDIGGYTPVRGGCIDHIAVVSARMKGWRTRTFPGSVSTHHRTMGTAQSGGVRRKIQIRSEGLLGRKPPGLGAFSCGISNETAAVRRGRDRTRIGLLLEYDTTRSTASLAGFGGVHKA